jgi:hypothetical protein
MAQGGTKTASSVRAEQRRKRLAAELRANLKKRKERARNLADARTAGSEHPDRDNRR